MSGGPLGALEPIVERKRAEASSLRCGAATLFARAEGMGPGRGFVAALHGGAVVAEMKRRSPSGGALRGDLDPTATARDYTEAGAVALSVLTDGPDFGGSLDDLVAARASTTVPVLRKDFTVDPVQVAEARAAGADAVLLIVAVLGRDGLSDCLEAARRCAVDALVEVHDEAEAETAVAAGARCVGVNSRDLRTLRTDLGVFARVRPLLPSGVVVVAESGMRDAEDAVRMVAAGADAVLAGEAFMRAPDPGAACAAMVAACRRAAGVRAEGRR